MESSGSRRIDGISDLGDNEERPLEMALFFSLGMATKPNIKICNCKKTNCLKSYCDCFAGGLYCNEACCCKECVNLAAYEDQVQLARECIEQRDPLAFYPKIHSLGGGDRLMPRVEKHRKGCKCKKSMCMQHYCECYKAKVGCWGKCQCEGCQNVHGMKRDCSDMVPLDEFKCLNLFKPVDINAVNKRLVKNLPYIPSEAGSSNSDMMIGTSTEEEYDMELPTFEHLEFLEWFKPEYFNERHDDDDSKK